VRAILAALGMLGAALVMSRKRDSSLEFPDDGHDHQILIHLTEAKKAIENINKIKISADDFCDQFSSGLDAAKAMHITARTHHESMVNPRPRILDELRVSRSEIDTMEDKFSNWCICENLSKKTPRREEKKEKREIDILFGPSPFKPWMPGDPL